MAHYPNITEPSLVPFRALKVQVDQGVELFDCAECPYPPDIRSFLKTMLVNAAENDRISSREGNSVVVEDDSWADELLDPESTRIDHEIAKLYRKVKNESSKHAGTDVKETMSLMRTANDLLIKLVSLQETRANIRNMALFKRAVVETLEEFLTPAARTEFLSKIEDAL